MRARRLLLIVTALAAIDVVSGGCGTDSTDAPASDDGGIADAADNDASVFGGDGGCKSSSECGDGGVCTATGVCCDSAAHVCGGACCTGASVCLFDQCVTPGSSCFSSKDCGPNEYCEPALAGGNGGGGVSDAGCTQPLPSAGKCLPRLPTCDGDAGALPDGGACVAACEYHPPSGGPLDATTKWSWGANAKTSPNAIDVWATPTVARMHDSNCDGKIDALDAPVIVFVSGNTGTVNCNAGSNPDPNACRDGVLRMIDGRTGEEVWSLASAGAGSMGFAVGVSVALGDLDRDGFMDIAAMTGEGNIVVVDRNGVVRFTSDVPYGTVNASTGWGGGLAVADMDRDGWPEIAYADTVWTMAGGALARRFVGAKGNTVGADKALSIFSDVDLAPDGHLELVAGNTAYGWNGTGATVLWQNTNVTDGYDAVADLNKDGKPEVVVVGAGNVWILDGATGAIVGTAFALSDTKQAGAPTVADFDGDGYPEIGVAQDKFYHVIKPTLAKGKITGMSLSWKKDNHDFSSSVTGSTVFDFEGDGKAEVVYADECWLWVFDGASGDVRLAVSHSSFTATEASLVADIDGDGHAEMLIPSQGVDMSSWNCVAYEQGASTMNGRNWTPGPQPNKSYRGLVAIGDVADSWVGTRTLWNEHSYHVSNVCDDSDNACTAPNVYGSIPQGETRNWSLPWLNDFRQNVQNAGIFNAPDAVVAIAAECVDPVVAHVSIRNIGQSGLPAGTVADVFVRPGDVLVGQATTAAPLLPGQTESLDVTLAAPATKSSSLYAEIHRDPAHPRFHECNEGNDRSGVVTPSCVR